MSSSINYKRILEGLRKILFQEEMIWYQRVRSKRLSLGDLNTSFFHGSTMAKQRRNSIGTIKLDDDN